MEKSEDTIPCNFCGKTNFNVKMLVAASDGTHVCDECIDVMTKMVVYHHYRVVLFQGNQ